MMVGCDADAQCHFLNRLGGFPNQWEPPRTGNFRLRGDLTQRLLEGEAMSKETKGYSNDRQRQDSGRVQQLHREGAQWRSGELLLGPWRN
jgi:hypothetical protein